jgi:ankyrin repeat protein
MNALAKMKTEKQLGMELDDAVNRAAADEVVALLDEGAPLEYRDPLGWTPLMNAAWVAAADIVQLLIGRGANLNARNREGKTALGMALEIGHNDYGHDKVIHILRLAGGTE